MVLGRAISCRGQGGIPHGRRGDEREAGDKFWRRVEDAEIAKANGGFEHKIGVKEITRCEVKKDYANEFIYTVFVGKNLLLSYKIVGFFFLRK